MTLQELGTGTILSTQVNHFNKRQFKMSADILPCRYTHFVSPRCRHRTYMCNNLVSTNDIMTFDCNTMTRILDCVVHVLTNSACT